MNGQKVESLKKLRAKKYLELENLFYKKIKTDDLLRFLELAEIEFELSKFEKKEQEWLDILHLKSQDFWDEVAINFAIKDEIQEKIRLKNKIERDFWDFLILILILSSQKKPGYFFVDYIRQKAQQKMLKNMLSSGGGEVSNVKNEEPAWTPDDFTM